MGRRKPVNAGNRVPRVTDTEFGKCRTRSVSAEERGNCHTLQRCSALGVFVKRVSRFVNRGEVLVDGMRRYLRGHSSSPVIVSSERLRILLSSGRRTCQQENPLWLFRDATERALPFSSFMGCKKAWPPAWEPLLACHIRGRGNKAATDVGSRAVSSSARLLALCNEPHGGACWVLRNRFSRDA